jgi:hypothetical protein
MTGSEPIEELAAKWNRLGRSHFGEMSARLRAFHEGQAEDVNLTHDPRDDGLAREVMAKVHFLNTQGQWQKARALFDPAHEPYVPFLEKVGQGLSCATILGPDEFLVRIGSSYQDGEMLHLTDHGVEVLFGVMACATSRDHETLLLVTNDGFSTSRGLGGTSIASFPWPIGTPRKLDVICVADGGRRIAFADDEEGVWVGTAEGGTAIWNRIYPREELIAEVNKDIGGVGHEWNDSMTHCALSPDGNFTAYGSQCYGHYLDSLDNSGYSRPWAKIGYLSEYPHNACFSDDGSLVSLNSCHFYNGVTASVETASIGGVTTEPYVEDPRVGVINQYLRVYASTWLPADATGAACGGFLLCGLGFATCVTPAGKVIFEQYFGSSASAVDYCPKTRRLIISSCSGFLHVYDVDLLDAADRVIGFNPRRELYRWVLWKDHDAIKW